jgi:hypothetical protein
MERLMASYEWPKCGRNLYGGTAKGKGTLFATFGAKNAPPGAPPNAAQVAKLQKNANDAAKAAAQAAITEATSHPCPENCKPKSTSDKSVGNPSPGQPEPVAALMDFHLALIHVHIEVWYWLIESECTWAVTVDCGEVVEG